MPFILAAFWFFVGFTVIMFINAQMILPLLYNLPVATYLYFKKRLLLRGVLIQPLTPLIWCVVFAALGFFFPRFADWMYNNDALNLGGLVGTVGMLYRALVSSKGRAEMWADFCQSTYDRYRLE